MNVEYAKISDFDAWIELAREVEPLFGPMADEAGFQEGLKMAIAAKTAFSICSTEGLMGGIVISKESNEIVWLAVSERYRQQGCGRELIKFAINQLNSPESIFVQTFAESVPEGRSARKLYSDFGFVDFKDGGLNPAGIATVIMRLKESGSQDM